MDRITHERTVCVSASKKSNDFEDRVGADRVLGTLSWIGRVLPHSAFVDRRIHRYFRLKYPVFFYDGLCSN